MQFVAKVSLHFWNQHEKKWILKVLGTRIKFLQETTKNEGNRIL
jgi:hypothetical protein